MRVKKEINIQIGEQIRLAREQAGFTQEQFSEQIEVSPQYVSDLERGVVGISVATLKRACTVLHVSSDQILFGKASEDHTAIIAQQCKELSKKQAIAIAEIIQKIVAAFQSE